MTQLTYAMPCYNHSSYLTAALDSIKRDIASHEYEYELLIIDDGSTDDSVLVIEAWAQQHSDINLKLIKQSNHGIAKTVNKLYNQSLGQYVRLCASDDTIEEGSSSALMSLISTRPTLICVFGDGYVIDDSGNVIGDSFIRYHGADPESLIDIDTLPGRLIKRWSIAGPCILVKRDFFTCYQYDENSKIDDFDFFLTLFQNKHSVAFLNEKVCGYRIHQTNTSKVKNVDVRIGNLESFLYLLNKHLANPKMERVKLELIERKYLTRCKINYLKGSYIKAVRDYALYRSCAFKNSLNGNR